LATYAVPVSRGARSKSTVLLAVVVAAIAVLGLVRALPELQRPDPGIGDIQPGELIARKPARGIVTLGEGVTVSVYSDGLRIERDDRMAFQTVRIAALFSAGFGRVVGTGAHRREEITSALPNLRFTSVDLSREGAVFHGQVFDDTRSLEATMAVRRVGQRVDIDVSVPGADLLVTHLWRRPGMHGVAPRLPSADLRNRAWWLEPAPGGAPDAPAFTTGLGASVGVASPAPTALDLRNDGRGEIHVWASAFRLSVW
jgi:hypothetical protein